MVERSFRGLNFSKLVERARMFAAQRCGVFVKTNAVVSETVFGYHRDLN